jgi:hypothetical protein
MNYHIVRALDTVGDGSGTKQAIGNYSTPTEFKLAPAAGVEYRVHRMLISLGDVGPFTYNTYGGLPVLTNGWQMYVANGSGIQYHLLDEDGPVKSTVDMEYMAFDMRVSDYAGNYSTMVARYSFNKFSTEGVVLKGDEGEYLAVNQRDNLTGLDTHVFIAQGEVFKGTS